MKTSVQELAAQAIRASASTFPSGPSDVHEDQDSEMADGEHSSGRRLRDNTGSSESEAMSIKKAMEQIEEIHRDDGGRVAVVTYSKCNPVFRANT